MPKKKSSSVKEPSQSSSLLQKETMPVEPKVIQRASKSIRKTIRDAPRDSASPSSPGLDSNSSLLPSPEQRKVNQDQMIRDHDYANGYGFEDVENINPMEGPQGHSISEPATAQFSQTQRSMTQDEVSREEEQEDMFRRQAQPQSRIDLEQYGYRPKRVFLPSDRESTQEGRSMSAPQENDRLEDEEADEDVLYAPQQASWRFSRQFQDPVQGTHPRLRASAQDPAPAGSRTESLRPETPRLPRPELPKCVRPGIPRLPEENRQRQRDIRGHREYAQHPPQAAGSQLELATQLASLQAKVLEANDNKAV